ncbi:MAG: MmgE/PrpD family protein, partial [Bacillota bacterium]
AIGHPVRLSVEQAALVNGASGHVWEIDDTHRQTMMHPGDSVIGAALAVGEWLGADGPRVLAAIVAGYEVAVRVCAAVSPSHLERGWHPSGTANTFGAAAAAGKLLGLDPKGMAWAFGLAATQAAGTFCHLPERAMSKDLNPGKAGANGVLAALLAAEGFTGSVTALENDKGFARTHADAAELDRITAGLGRSYRIDEVAFKPYSCCRHCHSAIDAALRLRTSYDIAAGDIRRVDVFLYPMAAALVNDPEPFEKGLYGARYSVHFNVALAMLAGEAGMERALLDQEYVRAMLDDPQVREIMRRVHVSVDAELARGWPDRWPARVAVHLRNGVVRQETVEYPLGEPENPMTYEQLVKKFNRASQGYLSTTDAARVLDTVENLDRLDNVVMLTGMLSK